MPTPMPPGFSLGVAEPRDTVAAFGQRKLLEATFRWQDVFQDEHRRAFAVAGVARMDVLQVFRDAVGEAIQSGRGFETFRDGIRPKLQAKGFWGDVEITDPKTGERRIARFNDARLRTIFEVNLRQSNAAGRWARIERTRKTKPFIVYRTMQDERVRASHRPWNGLVLPIDHPFWAMHFPPNGWRCRCHAYAVSERDIARMQADGQPVKRDAPPERYITYVNPSTGEVVPVPHGVDPGFAHHPVKERDVELYNAALRKAGASYPIAAARVVAEATLANPAIIAQSDSAYARWIDRIVARGHAVGEAQYPGVIEAEFLRAMRDLGVEPESAVITLHDAAFTHALRLDKPEAIRATVEMFKQLPDNLRNPAAVLLEQWVRKGQRGASLLYVAEIPGAAGQILKWPVDLDFTRSVRNEGNRASVKFNFVRTATIVDLQALADTVRYRRLRWRLGDV